MYNRFADLPVLGAVRGVYRFAIPMALGASLAAAFSCRGWIAWLGQRRAPALGLAGLLPLLIFLEFLRIPLQLAPLPEPPQVYRGAEFRQHHAGRAVLELPLWVSGADFRHGEEFREHLWYQTIHGLPMVGGHVSRLTESEIAHFTGRPSLMRLTRARGTDGYDGTAGADLRQVAADFELGVVTVSRARYHPAEEAALLAFLREWLPLTELERSERFIVFSIAPIPADENVSTREVDDDPVPEQL
jgi:hypothetical protein